MARARTLDPPKPKTLKHGPRGSSWRCIVLRGPHSEDAASWYWTCRRGSETIWSAWLTAAAAHERFGATVNGSVPVATADSQTLLVVLLNAWLDHQEYRVGERASWERTRAEREAAAGRAASPSGQRRPGIASGSLRRYEQACSRIAQMLGPDSAVSEVPSRLGQAVRDRMEAGGAATTVSSDLDALAAAWSWGGTGDRRFTLGLDLELPYVGRETKREKYTPSRHEVLRAAAHLTQPWMQQVVRVQLEHGCRIEAIADLTPARVDLGRRELRLVAKGHDRWVPMTPTSSEVLAPLVAGKSHDEPLFGPKSTTIKSSLNGEDWRQIAPRDWQRAWAARSLGEAWKGPWQHGWTLAWLRAWSTAWALPGAPERIAAVRELCPTADERRGSVSRAWRRVKGLARACLDTGCRRFTTHGIRRRTCTDFISSNMAVHLYSELAGHSAEVALKHYADADRASKAEAMAAVVRAWGGSPGNVVAAVIGGPDEVSGEELHD